MAKQKDSCLDGKRALQYWKNLGYSAILALVFATLAGLVFMSEDVGVSEGCRKATHAVFVARNKIDCMLGDPVCSATSEMLLAAERACE